MVKYNARLQNLPEIRQYVSKTLSQIDLLQPDSFHITERLLLRAGRPCGLYFCLHGPRAVRLTAIWETDNNTILFYSSCGQRIQKTQLEDGPALTPPKYDESSDRDTNTEKASTSNASAA